MNWWQTLLWWVVVCALLSLTGNDLNLLGAAVLGVAVGALRAADGGFSR